MFDKASVLKCHEYLHWIETKEFSKVPEAKVINKLTIKGDFGWKSLKFELKSKEDDYKAFRFVQANGNIRIQPSAILNHS